MTTCVVRRGRRLSDRLAPAQNNFDLLRLVASLSVIVSHAYTLAPAAQGSDFLESAFGLPDLGATAVKIFFFLSGLLVGTSILARPKAASFLIKRAFRIFPALIVCMLICAYGVGLVATTHDKISYLTDKETLQYFALNSTLWNLRFLLPGVFEGAPHGINGSIWTLPIEFYCYLVLSVCLMLGLLRSKWLGGFAAVVVILVATQKSVLLPHLFQYHPGDGLLAASFALGVLAALFAEHLILRMEIVVFAWLCFYVFDRFTAGHEIFYLAMFYSVLVLFTSDPVTRFLRLPFDASYGVYLYGFVVQATVGYYLPQLNVHLHQALSLATALLLGLLSWHLVEKHGIRIGGRIARLADDWITDLAAMLRWRLRRAVVQLYYGWRQAAFNRAHRLVARRRVADELSSASRLSPAVVQPEPT